ncbi:MAG TPA: flagellar basal-body MS-ring/collar protein FliF [Solirubrobacteraceae bacterium]|nr:flagellar basal-body MS-ring/collar protein FliF [Solirubrobacteraceae bacterium]
MPPFVETFRALPARSKAVIAVSAVAIVGVAFIMLRIAGAPSYSILASGLDPAKTGEITAALDEQGIAYELRNNGTALAVEKAQAAQARVQLAGAGVNVTAGGGEGFELFDEQKLGASEFQQQVTYQRALEGEIARTIGAVDGVSNPSVQLVLPEDDLFADEASPSTAAVMLGNSADTMDPGAVRGIAQLVSSSVKGLKTDNVTITDASGSLLWPQGEGAGGGGMVAGKQALEAKYSRAMEADLNALLTRTLGPGKGQVSVTADLNADKTTQDEVIYEKKGVPLKTQTETERLRGGGATTGGTAGTGSNIPQYSASAAGGGANSNYQRETENTEFGVGKKVARTEIAPGAVNKLNVALLIDKSVPAADFASIQEAVTSAAGIDAERGDTMQAAQVPFAKVEAPKAGPVPTSLLGPLKWVGIGLASLIFLFFMSRALRKREGEALAAPAWLTTIEEPVSLAQLEQQTQVMGPPTNPTITLPPRAPDANLQAMDQLMEREPERVAAQVKQWMSED